MAIVLWFLAAMSLLVSGIVYEARSDVKLAQMHGARAKAEAAGDGAIQMLMAALETNDIDDPEGERFVRGQFIVGEQPVSVTLVPESGLIDLNQASIKILQSLFEIKAGLDESDAQVLAQNVNIYRRTKFGALEDFLRAQGATRAILDSIRDSVRVGSGNVGRFQLSAAPGSVLDVMLAINPEGVAAQKSGFENTGQSTSDSRRTRGPFRADARVTVGDKVWLRRQWVSRKKDAGSSLPWTITRSERTRVERSG